MRRTGTVLPAFPASYRSGDFSTLGKVIRVPQTSDPAARRRTHQEANETEQSRRAASSVLMTTHSPHIVSVSPLNSLVLLKKSAGEKGTHAVSTANLQLEHKDRQDLERYLDVTRGEMLFAKGVFLVEGEAELYVLPALGKLMGFDFDELGYTVCSVAGTNFSPYVKLLGPACLDIPVCRAH